MIRKSLFLGILALFTLTAISLGATYPKVGVLCCGDLWETFAPSGIWTDYTSSDVNVLVNWEIVRIGNLERNWLTPTEMYPGGDQFGLPWSQQFVMVEYSNIANFNNYTTSTDERAKKYVYAFAMPKTVGVPKSSNGDSKGATPWMDDARTGQLYTATVPTNIGVNINLRARSYCVNEANMNDWIAVELELTNTGVQDINCDGVVDRTGHVIEALSLECRNEHVGLMGVSTAGGRWGVGFASTRLSGYDASPDPDGNPWDATVNFDTNVDMGKVDANGWAPDNERKIGFRSSGWRSLFDIWDGNSFIAVKQGSMAGGFAAPDKKTIYDSPTIGDSNQRGWFASSNRSWGNAGRNPWEDFITATGTFYEDGGRTWAVAAIKPLKPDPNWFDTTKPYTPDDPLSFVSIVKPEGQRGQPKGDMKYIGKWLQNWERNFPGTPSPRIPDADCWTAGGTSPNVQNFDGDKLVGVGPLRLEVGETITVVWVEYAGHRLKGLRQSLKAARWAYENNWNIPKPPPMPDLKVSPVQLASGGFNNKIVWDKKAESDPNFAGYKIYRVSAYPTRDYRKLGVQFLSNYHHQTAADIGATDDQLIARYCEANNPNISVLDNYVTLWGGNPSGPWRIQAYITKDQLANYANTGDDKTAYPYVWIDTDKDIQIGYTYWYYVAAFNTASGTMAGVNYTGLESSKMNWNGRDGRWYGTYHFATANGDFPTYDLTSQKFIGAAYVLKPARVDRTLLLAGTKKIEVRPNPYKVQAPHDVGMEHKVQFYNLAADTRITILDLSGQIMDVLEYEGQDPRDGAMFWDMFTKDGPEVASGLYIWVAEYPGGQQQGYLAIER